MTSLDECKVKYVHISSMVITTTVASSLSMVMMSSGILPTLPWNRGIGAKGFQVREQKDLLHGVAPHDVLPQDLHILLIVGYVECVVIGLHHNFSLTLFTKRGVLSTALFGVFFK